MEALDSFQLLCNRLLQTARSHSEKDRLRELYQSSQSGEELWPVVFAEMNQIRLHYDRLLNPVEGK